MRSNPYEPPSTKQEASLRPRERWSPGAIAGYGCGGLSLFLMFVAYQRMMFPPRGWFMGDPELFMFAGPAALVGLLLSSIPFKWIPFVLNIATLVIVALPLMAEVIFNTQFPPRIGP